MSSLLESLKVETASLKKTNSDLKKKNKSLLTQKNKRQQRLQRQRRKISTRNFQRIQSKLAKAGMKMVPFIGAPLIAGSVANDIHEYCSDIDEMNELEIEMFGGTGRQEHQYCGVYYEKKIQELQNEAKEKYDWVILEMGHQREETVKFLVRQINSTMQLIEGENKEIQDYYISVYKDLVEHFKNMPSSKDILDETIEYWDKRFEG